MAGLVAIDPNVSCFPISPLTPSFLERPLPELSHYLRAADHVDYRVWPTRSANLQGVRTAQGRLYFEAGWCEWIGRGKEGALLVAVRA
jgi:hypothetical protein